MIKKKLTTKTVSNLDFSELEKRWDSFIRDGKSAAAQSELTSLIDSRQKIPRPYLAPFARLARRLSLPYLSLAIMRPVIRPSRPLIPAVTDAEYCVYAGALAKIGALAEAEAIFDTLDPEKIPEVAFHRVATVLFQQWRYSAAIPLLKKYIQHPSLNQYDRSVAQINLAAAYVNEQKTNQAATLLNELRISLKEARFKLLYGNALELSAQLEISRGKFELAEDYLRLGREILEASSNLSEFFLRKWGAIIAICKSAPPTPAALLTLQQIRQEAIERNHWETVRESDFYLAQSTQNEDLFCFVYFGTPWERYRQKMNKKKEFLKPLPKTYLWNVVGGKLETNARIFDLQTGQEKYGGKAHIPTNGALHQTLKILCRDFYRPVSLGTLFANLFPDEYFNLNSSPTRVAQVIQRLRNWFEENQIPIQIAVSKGEYRLVATGPYMIEITLEKTSSDPQTSRLDVLKKKWPYQAFSPKQAAVELGCSVSSSSRLLGWATENKKIIRFGKGGGILYRFGKKIPKKFNPLAGSHNDRNS